MKLFVICGYKPNINIVNEYKILENYTRISIDEDLFPPLVLKQFDEIVFKDDVNKYLYTNNPYILNYFNLLIMRYDKTGVGLNFEDISCIFVNEDFEVENLKLTEERVINTNVLSDTINDIYDEYNKLAKI